MPGGIIILNFRSNNAGGVKKMVFKNFHCFGARLSGFMHVFLCFLHISNCSKYYYYKIYEKTGPNFRSDERRR